MNITQKFSFLFTVTTMICAPLHSAEQKKAALTTVIKDVRTSLEQATESTAKRISEAINAKNRLLIGSMPKQVKETKIAEQDKIIATAQQELLKLADSAVNIADETEKQASYLSQFVSSARNLGSKAVSSAKDIYYGNFEQERLLAQVVIAELEQLKITETNPAILKQIDHEIYKQKLISGDEMTTQKKLLIGAAIAAATVVGVMLTNDYLNKPSIPVTSESKISQTIEQPPVIPAQTSVISKLENALKQTALEENEVTNKKLTNQLNGFLILEELISLKNERDALIGENLGNAMARKLIDEEIESKIEELILTRQARSGLLFFGKTPEELKKLLIRKFLPKPELVN